MKLARMADLCKQLSIPRRTFNRWVEVDPDLAVMIAGAYWIKLDKLVGRPGINLIEAYTIGSNRWVKAVELAKRSKISRRTIAHWCLTRAGFGKRIGRCWYVDLDQLGASSEEVDTLHSHSGNNSPQEQDSDESEDDDV